MKLLKPILAVVTMVLVSAMITGCGTSQKDTALARITEAQGLKKSVTLQLESTQEKDSVKVNVTLDNPENKPITSVQLWFGYNSKLLKGVHINADQSPFNLVAPYPNGFDEKMGLIKIGRSTSAPVTDTKITVAQIELKKLGSGTVMLEAYDYQEDLAGHTSVNTVVKEVPYNILLQPVSPLLIIN